jgi:hypothetical protein
MDLDVYAEDFIRRMDAGEFDGRLIETAGKLNRDQLASVHRLLVEREHPECDQHTASVPWRRGFELHSRTIS